MHRLKDMTYKEMAERLDVSFTLNTILCLEGITIFVPENSHMITSTMKLRLPIVFFLLYIIVLTAFPQSDERFFNKYNYHYITGGEKALHSFVDDILCDSEGFIWMATHNGIGRYDGYQVMSINTQTQPLKLKNDYVHTLCEDNFRRLWIGSEGGLEVIDLNTYAIIDFYSLLNDTLRELADGYIHSL